jgi:hypothetical protein
MEPSTSEARQRVLHSCLVQPTPLLPLMEVIHEDLLSNYSEIPSSHMQICELEDVLQVGPRACCGESWPKVRHSWHSRRCSNA